MSTNNHYAQYKYLLMTLDPVHIGTGGYRLGRVDNSIIREPGTNIPKIPGTSLSGAIRHYAAYQYGKIKCAGKGDQSSTLKHCGNPTCPICYSFGYTRGDQGGHAGTVNIFDAHILFFPVHSMAGPVWVTTPNRLIECGFGIDGLNDESELTLVNELPSQNGEGVENNWWENDHLNLGWLMLSVQKDGKITKYPDSCNLTDNKTWETIAKRLVVVNDKIFSQVVNSNLEVRTSVSINPQTGAAEEGALFTYEAIPRATWLMMDVVVDDYRKFFPSQERVTREWKNTFSNGDVAKQKEILTKWRLPIDDDKLANSQMKALKYITEDSKYYEKSEVDWDKPSKLIDSSLKLVEALGVGGMGTRGFGRLKSLDNWEVKNG